MAEDNFDIEFDRKLQERYNRNQQNQQRFNNSAEKVESDKSANVDKQFSDLAELEAANSADNDSSGFVNNVADFAKFLPIGGLKGLEETGKAFHVLDDNQFGLPEPKNIGGALGQGIGQFLPLFIGAGGVLRGGAKLFGLFQKSNKLSKAGQGLINVGAGGISDALAFDPKDENLGNLALSVGAIAESPRASAMVKEYLAQQDEDSDLKARAKNALIGGLAGAITDGLIRGAGYVLKKNKVTKVSAEDGLDEDGFLKNADEQDLEDTIETGKVDSDISEQEIADAVRPIAEDYVDILDAAKASAKEVDGVDAFKAFKELAPDHDTAIVQTIAKSEAAVNKWFDTLATETPEAADEIVQFFHDRINGKVNFPIADFRIRSGRNAGKPLIESMNFLKLDTEEDARQALQFVAGKLDIKKLVKPSIATKDLDTIVPELISDFIDATDELAVNNSIKQIALAANNVDEAIKFVGTSKLLAGIADEQLQLAAKADVSKGTKASRQFLLDKIKTTNLILQAGGLLSKKSSDLLRSFSQGVKAVDNVSLLKRELTTKLNSVDPKVSKANSHLAGVLNDQDTLTRKLHFEELNTTRKVTITRAETTLGKRITNRVKSLQKTLNELKSPSRGKVPKKEPVTSKEIEKLQAAIKKVKLERDTLQNEFKREAPEQVKIQKQAAKLSKEIKDLREGKVKKPNGKPLEPTEISKLRTTKEAELEKLKSSITESQVIQKRVDKLNTEFNNLLIKRIRQDSPDTPIPTVERTSLEQKLQKAINRENQTLKDRVDTKVLQEELVLKGSRQIQDEINSMSLMQLKTRLAAINKGSVAKGFDTLLEVYINGLLSSVKTIANVNPIGHASALVTNIIERAFAGATGNQIAMRESVELAWNSITGLGDAWKTFLSVMRKGTDDPNIKSDLTIRAHERALSKEHFNLGGPLGAAVDFIGTVVNLPGKLLLAQDQAFKGLVIRGETRALAFRKARNKFGTENLRDPAVKVKIAKEFDSIMKDLTEHPDITEGAKQTALKNSFTNDLPDKITIDPRTGKEKVGPGLSKLIQSTIDKYGLLRVFVPFFRTPVNILNFTLERTPILQFASKTLRNELTSSDEAVKQLARARVGTSFAISGAMFGAALTGNFSGSPPTDRRLRANLEEQMGGSHWHSININGKWHKYDRFDPFGILMGAPGGTTAQAKHIISLKGKLEEEGDPSGLIRRKYDEVINSTAMGIVEMLKDRHYVQGISEFISLITADDRSLTPSLRRLSTFGNPVIGFYSSFRRGVTQGFETNKPRKLQRGEGSEDGLKKTGFSALVDEMVKSHEEAFAGVTPGYGDIPPRKNLIGDVVAYPGTGGEFDLTHNLVTTMTSSSPGLIRSKSPLINKLAELESSVDQPSSIQKMGNIVLTEEEKTFIIDEWTSLNKTVVEPLIQESFFNTLPQGTQKDVLENLILEMKQAAMKLALVEFPDRLANAFIDDKIRTALIPTSSQPQGFQSLLNLGQ